MKLLYRTTIALCVFLAIVFLTAGIAAAIKPVANFEYRGEPLNTSNFNIYFTDTSTNNPTSWTWYFGDDEMSTEQNPSHEYSSSGYYWVTLIARNADGSSFIIKEINVQAY